MQITSSRLTPSTSAAQRTRKQSLPFADALRRLFYYRGLQLSIIGKINVRKGGTDRALRLEPVPLLRQEQTSRLLRVLLRLARLPAGSFHTERFLMSAMIMIPTEM